MKLCIIESIFAVRMDGQVAVFKLLGNDYWACNAESTVQVSGHAEPLHGYNLQPGMRVWLNIEALIKEGVFAQDCVVDGVPSFPAGNQG